MNVSCTCKRGQGFMHELLGDHESIIVHLRANITHIAETLKDAGSSDFITQLLERHEKMAWMLRSHLKKIPVNFIHHFKNEK